MQGSGDILWSSVLRTSNSLFSMMESLKKGRKQTVWFSRSAFIIFCRWSSKEMALQESHEMYQMPSCMKLCMAPCISELCFTVNTHQDVMERHSPCWPPPDYITITSLMTRGRHTPVHVHAPFKVTGILSILCQPDCAWYGIVKGGVGGHKQLSIKQWLWLHVCTYWPE